MPMGEFRSEDLIADLREETEDLLMNLDAIVRDRKSRKKQDRTSSSTEVL